MSADVRYESEHKKGQFEPARVRKLNEKHFRTNALKNKTFSKKSKNSIFGNFCQFQPHIMK
jgi:hypothetical protein